MSASVNTKQPVVDHYDPRHLQSKALERWERQKRVWDSVRDALLRETTQGPASALSGITEGSARNFADSARYARERAEDFGMIEAGVPRSALGSNHIWESQLRQDDATESGTRLVQIGKAIYPYALYGIVKDPASLRADNPTYARVIPEPDDQAALDGTTIGATRAQRATQTRAAVRNTTAKSHGRTEPDAVAESEMLKATLEDTDSENTYYQQQLELYFPYIQQRFPHFMLPREYMQVDAQPAPRMSLEEMKAYIQRQSQRSEAGERPTSPAPVQYFPPPQPIQLHSSRPGTGTGTPSGAARYTEEAGASDSYAARLLDPSQGNATKSHRSAAVDDASYDKDDYGLVSTDHDDDEAGLSEARLPNGPTLLLSSTELSLSGDVGQLLHAELRITNTSSMTCYYSWEPVDSFGEDIEDRRLVAQLSGRDDTPKMREGRDSAGARRDDFGSCSDHTSTPRSPMTGNEETEDADALPVAEVLHGLLHRPSASTRAFFRLAKPLNGVILPEETETFPFSVRPPTAGFHSQTYELLTIPPLPERILVKLAVVATSREPALAKTAELVDRLIEARARADEARRVVQAITRGVTTPYEEADLRQAIHRRELAQARKEKAAVQKQDRQRAQWTRANKAVTDGLPYNSEVYAAAERLHANVAATMERLGQPLRTGKRPWDGSVRSLLQDTYAVRDAAAHAVLYEGLLVLLRAARVSRKEDEPLATLVRRAAEAAADLAEQRALPLMNSEAELRQYTHETTAASLAGASGAGAGTGGSSRRPGSTQKRSAGASAGGGGSGGSGVPQEGAAPVVGSLRESMKAPAPTSRAEQESLHSELSVLKALKQVELRESHPKRVDQCVLAFTEAIDAACNLPLLDVVMASRLEKVEAIQSAPLMETKATLDLPPPVTKAAGRKK